VERKLATVLFVDLVDSTSLLVSDPEIVRRRQTQFFEGAARCIAAHGGIVEKYAGDAVMAAFGVPQAHEDDAERAVRAALAILEKTAALGLDARVGVESGEVVFDERDSTFATGEAVNIAARLQQAAQPNQVLLGPAAFRLTLNRFQVEDAGPLDLRGHAQPVWTWRVICATDGVPRRRSVAPLIGRDSELELLRLTYDRAVRDRRAHLFTVFGEPGVGKTRLALDFTDSLDGATVLVGRALPYGEGVTYWPVAEMVKAAAGITDDDPLAEAQEKLRVCCEDEAVADLLGLASGVLEAVEGERSQKEIAWAVRRWSELIAAQQPLVLVFEDIHWAEEPLLELIEHLVERVQQVPLLVVCLARPELLEIHSSWGGGRVRATSIELEPLDVEQTEALMDELLADVALPAAQIAELVEKTGGNPLFVEETIRMLAEDGSGRIPDTVQALIAARIDRLPPDAKSVLRRAAVIGRTFWPGALEALAPEVEVAPALEHLLRREFVLPEDRSTISGESAHRFKHVLIREVAYSGLSKSSRASLHEAFAAWLAERAGEELLEIRAYHLDQAAALLAELDGEAPEALRRQAAAALEAAGGRALAREANRSARRVFLRAVELEPTLRRRYLAARAAWRLDDLPAVAGEMQRVADDAVAAGDAQLEGRALVALGEMYLVRDADLPLARQTVERALDLLPADDNVARFDALRVLATAAWWVGDADASREYAVQIRAVADASGRLDLRSAAALRLGSVYLTAAELDQADEQAGIALALAEESGSIVRRGDALHLQASVHEQRREHAEAEELYARAIALFAEAGSVRDQARSQNHLAALLLYQEKDLAQAERLLRDAIRILKPLGERGFLCESQRLLSQLVLGEGKLEEAERLALESRETVGPHDVTSRATTRMALGLVREAQGREAEAEELLREAVDIVQDTAVECLLGEPPRQLARFLRDHGRPDDGGNGDGGAAADPRREARARGGRAVVPREPAPRR
jgi:class 3 adenylate cyclase/tetratricopeptide (TPR) repeat protein